jgi:hypothetical protein
MIELIHDTSPALGEIINRYGCNFRVLAAMAEVYLGKALTELALLRLAVKAAADQAVMQPVMRMRTLEGQLIGWAFRELGDRHHFGIQVGQIVGGQPQFWPAFQDGRGWTFQKLWWETSGPDGHFTLGDHDGAEIFDPHNPQDLTPPYIINKKRVAARYLYRIGEG